jgi:acetylornithine/succinyldiaminopimelate/putrescine aminotransferase
MDTDAIILEPVQGEGCIFSIGKDFLESIRNICITNNILLIVDEVQCGSMRTCTW